MSGRCTCGARRIRGARVWHIDAHHDAYGSTDPAAWRALVMEPGAVTSATSATYLLQAWRAGIVAQVVWLVPAWLGVPAARADFEREMGSAPSFFTFVDYSTLAHPRSVTS